MSTVSLLLLYTYEMKIIITYYQISFEIFMLSILHILYMDPHVSKYIIYYFGTTVNWLLKFSIYHSVTRNMFDWICTLRFLNNTVNKQKTRGNDL